MVRDYPDEARILKAFCDDKRLRMLALLLDGEKCVCALYEDMGLPQLTLSYHMKILCDSGVVEGRQEGKWTHYRISARGVRDAADILAAYAPKEAMQPKDEGCCMPLRVTNKSHGEE